MGIFTSKCKRVLCLVMSILLCIFSSCKKDSQPKLDFIGSPATSGHYLLFDADEYYNSGKSTFPSVYTSIFYCNVDGTGITQVTPNEPAYYSYRPSWSPDGKQVIYTRGNQSDNDRSISVIDVTGKNFKKVATGDEADYGCFSPDGTKIAYAKSLVHVIPYNYDVYVANADGTGEKRLTSFADDNGGVSDLHWASDGRIYFSGYGNTSKIGVYSIDPDGINLKFLLSDVYFLGVSPDAKHLLFDLGDGLYTCNIDGSNIKKIVVYDNNNPNMLVGAAWSPTNNIYLANADYPTNFGIYRITDDGSNNTRILLGYYEFPSVF